MYIASELARTEGIAVNDDEIAYIAMHVGAYLDGDVPRARRCGCAVSAPAYHDVHTALAERDPRPSAVDDDVEVVGRRAATGPTPPSCSSPCSSPPPPCEHLVVVAPFPTEADLERVRTEITRVRRARRQARLAAALSSYIAPELFVRGLRGLDRDGAIRMLGERMIAVGVIDHAYVEGALERERLVATAFTEHLAVPHAMTMTARRTAIAIAVDDVPIDWAGASVNVVALIAFAESGRAEFQEVFDQFVEAFSERENVQRLVQGAEDYPGLLTELARLMETARHVAGDAPRGSGRGRRRRAPARGTAVLGGEHPEAGQRAPRRVLPVRGVAPSSGGHGPVVVLVKSSTAPATTIGSIATTRPGLTPGRGGRRGS